MLGSLLCIYHSDSCSLRRQAALAKVAAEKKAAEEKAKLKALEEAAAANLKAKAEALAAMPPKEKAAALAAMQPAEKAEVLAAMPPEDRVEALVVMPAKEKAAALAAMPPDEEEAARQAVFAVAANRQQVALKAAEAVSAVSTQCILNLDIHLRVKIPHSLSGGRFGL